MALYGTRCFPSSVVFVISVIFVISVGNSPLFRQDQRAAGHILGLRDV